MARIAPLDRQDLAEFEPFFQIVEQTMGFVPRSLQTLAHRPDLLRGFAGLVAAVLGPGQLAPELKQLVAYVASSAAGCRYCQAHTSHSAQRAGAAPEKVAAAFEFETSPLFEDAERAALRLARDAAFVPNEVRDEHFEALRPHFSDEQLVELVSVVSLFGFLNRWNDTVATQLEDAPRAFAETHLAGAGWRVGKHD